MKKIIKSKREGNLHRQILYCKRNLLCKQKRNDSKAQSRWMSPTSVYSFIRELDFENMKKEARCLQMENIEA